MAVWWQFGISLMAVSLNQQLTSGSLVETATKLPLVGGSFVAVWWQFGGSLMAVWWQFNGSFILI